MKRMFHPALNGVKTIAQLFQYCLVFVCSIGGRGLTMIILSYLFVLYGSSRPAEAE